jgi:hypothetical protein
LATFLGVALIRLTDVIRSFALQMKLETVKALLAPLGEDSLRSHGLQSPRKALEIATGTDAAAIRQVCRALLQTPQQLRTAVRALRENCPGSVLYTELQLRVKEHTSGGMSISEVLETVLASIKDSEKFPGTMRVLLVVDERDPLDDIVRSADLAVRFRNAGVVGFGLYIEERKLPSAFEATLKSLREHNVPLVVMANRCALSGSALVLSSYRFLLRQPRQHAECGLPRRTASQWRR